MGEEEEIGGASTQAGRYVGREGGISFLHMHSCCIHTIYTVLNLFLYNTIKIFMKQ